MRPPHRYRVPAALSVAVLLLGCRSRPDEGALQNDAAAVARATAATVPAVVEAGPALDAEADAVSLTGPEPPIGDGGTWIASDVYDLKVESVKYCKQPEKSDAAPGSLGLLLGVKVQVMAKTDEFFADVRHATLRDGGILIQPKVDQPFLGCLPQLKGVSLQRGKATSGFIVFEVPKFSPNFRLEYHPQRWGGAGTVRVKLAEPK